MILPRWSKSPRPATSPSGWLPHWVGKRRLIGNPAATGTNRPIATAPRGLRFDCHVERQVESKAPNTPSTPKCDPYLHIWFSSSLPRGGIFLQTSRERVVRRECGGKKRDDRGLAAVAERGH
jgi:hypothetical protein